MPSRMRPGVLNPTWNPLKVSMVINNVNDVFTMSLKKTWQQEKRDVKMLERYAK
jgi:hypothetical protein